MPVNTKKVEGRRSVRYESYDDLLADAEKHANGDVRALGNWSPGQMYAHLAMAFDVAIDGTDFSIAAPMRWMLKLLMKKKMLNKGIPSGFGAPDSMVPGETSAVDGLAMLRKSIERLRGESQRANHPAFGKLTREEWDLFNLRHAEMHLSFLVSE